MYDSSVALLSDSLLPLQTYIILMIRRQKLAQFRLQKISESSSPTSSTKKKQSIPERLNPLTLTSITINHFRPEHAQQQKQGQITTIQEQIMAKKLVFTSWDQAQQKRMNGQKKVSELFGLLIQHAKFIGRANLDSKRVVLRAVQKGRKGVIRWLLCIVRELFWMVASVLTQRRIQK